MASIEPSVGMTMYQPYWLLWVGNGRAVHRGGVSFFTMCFQDAEGRGGGWLHGRYALTPWDTAPKLLKVEGEGGFMGGMH